MEPVDIRTQERKAPEMIDGNCDGCGQSLKNVPDHLIHNERQSNVYDQDNPEPYNHIMHYHAVCCPRCKLINESYNT